MSSDDSDTSLLRLFREMLAKLAMERRNHRCISPELSDAWDNSMAWIDILTTIMMLEGWSDDTTNLVRSSRDDTDAAQLE